MQFFRLRGSLTKVIRASFLGSSTGKLPGAGIAGESHTRELFCNERRSARNTKQADVKLGASYDAHLPLFTIEAVEVGRRWRGWWIERDRWRRWWKAGRVDARGGRTPVLNTRYALGTDLNTRSVLGTSSQDILVRVLVCMLLSIYSSSTASPAQHSTAQSPLHKEASQVRADQSTYQKKYTRYHVLRSIYKFPLPRGVILTTTPG